MGSVEGALAGDAELDNAAPREAGGSLYNEATGDAARYKAQIDLIGSGPFFNPSPLDAVWLPIFFWPFVLPILIISVIVGLINPLFGIVNNLTMMTIFTCFLNCTGNPPLWSYWIWAVGAVSTLIVLKKNKGRLGLFMAYKKILGNGSDHWWAMGGVWTWTYDQVSEITRDFQTRGALFGNNSATVPGVFPPGVSHASDANNPRAGAFLLWIDGPKHTVYRRVFHQFFIGQFQLIKQRFVQLPEILLPVFQRNGGIPQDAAAYNTMANAKVAGQDYPVYIELVSRAVWWVLFGCKLDESEIPETCGWKDAVAFFILPQFVQNIACGLGVKKVTALRKSCVTIMCKRPGLVKVFQDLNDSLDLSSTGGANYSNPDVTQTMDEIQFAVNFAGLLGTSQLLQSTLSNLVKKEGEQVPPGSIMFPDNLNGMDYTACYNSNPVRFLKEVARLDPPVTSANATTQKPMTINQSPCCFGGKVDVPVGTGNQYLVSLAMRDEKQFPNPKEFNPSRSNWNKNLSWNGTFPFPQECQHNPDKINDDSYDPMAAPTYDPNGPLGAVLPLTSAQANNTNRICPGRNIALQINTMILGMCPALNKTDLTIKPGGGDGA